MAAVVFAATTAAAAAAERNRAHTPTIINNLLAPDLLTENVHDEIFQFYFMGQKVYTHFFLLLSSHAAARTCRYLVYLNVRTEYEKRKKKT